jgi:hypothetical protein
LIASPAVPSSPVSQTLASAAFGDDPGRWPLPASRKPQDRWLRAVAAGGQGYYGCANSELAEVRRSVQVGPLASLAHSTQGSLLRQLGWHQLARGWDGRAVVLAGDDVEARVDALVGLAADALGTGRFTASAALLEHARATLRHAVEPSARLAVRVHWVGAELAMASGDGAAAVRLAEQAVEFSATTEVSVRHRTKSDVVLAAALCCRGRLDAATAVADKALDATTRMGLIPLGWAVASLLAGIGSAAHTPQQVLVIRDEAADMVVRRGGSWCGR